jgi:hypothetical protein
LAPKAPRSPSAWGTAPGFNVYEDTSAESVIRSLRY